MTQRLVATPLRAVFWAATWGIGVAGGVALGGWLTVVGGAGAPGVESLEIAGDIVHLPGIAGSVVFLAHLAGQGVLAVARRRRSASRDSHDGEDGGEERER